MSQSTVLQTLNLLEADEEFQEKSDLHKFYKKFSNVIKDAHKIYAECDDSLKKNKNVNINCFKNEEIQQAWDDFLGERKTISDKKYCDYIMHWIYGKTEECKSNRFCINLLYSNLQKFWENSYCCEKEKVNKEEEASLKKNECQGKENCQEKDEYRCKRKIVKEFDLKVLKNKKSLYDFLKYYNIIRNKLNGKKSDTDVYCKYISHNFDIHHYMHREDEKNVIKKYSELLQLFKSIFKDEDALSEIKKKCNITNLSATAEVEAKNEVTSTPKYAKTYRDIIVDFPKYVKDTPKEIDDILGETISYKLYKEFDSDEYTVDFQKNNCNKFNELDNTYKTDSENICKGIIRNNQNFLKINSTIKHNERCEHYRNWVYYKIWKMFSSKNNYNDAGKVIGKFAELQNDIIKNSEKNFCQYSLVFTDLGELNDKKEEKDLYDYFKSYSFIEKNISAEVVNDKDKYTKYLTYIINLYNKHKKEGECCDSLFGVHPLCHHYFSCEEEYDPNGLLSILNGTLKLADKKKGKNIPLVIIGDDPVPTDVNPNDVMNIQYGRCSKVYYPKDLGIEPSLRCDYKAPYPHYEKFVSKLTEVKKKESKEPVEVTTATPINDSGTSSSVENVSNPVYFKIGTSGALVMGVLFISFLYYKFTPFGSLFRKRDRRISSIEDDFHEEYMQQFSSHDSEYEDVHSHNRRIKIAYHRT
ncbi:PIR Superfamily Protein [Plasmodium ovale wallikeri]|uniref:PIR Superfamily Protein n=1 Tax=Plasmodium ovale wallikeri TaxID=864142 RepID=A0A1A9AKB7_PLAOA|nr:PIR Superfamily Protein [Plasmodium ovale wallikeri]SBT56663.1 PIR Superfamily Protein [Plasmodium ovale wallikeri]